jgi:N-acyl-D-aspartate/D-glutamate deacylase
MEGTPVASVLAPWTEVSRLVGVLGDCGSGVFQLAREQDAYGDDREVSAPHSARMIALAAECRRPVTFGVVALTRGRWRTNLELVEEAARTPGADIFGQCEVNESAILVSFETRLPFDRLPVWRELRSQSLGVQATLLDNPELRERLVRAAEEGPYQSKLGTMASRPDFDWIRVLRNPLGPNPTVADVARERGVHPVAAMIDVAREQGLQQFFQQIVGNRDPAAVEELVTHPRIVPTFTDSGAHVSQVMNASLHTYLLAHWVRERGVLSLAEAVRRITSMPAEIWGLGDRGLLKPGWIADVNIIDPTTVAPLMPSLVADLPGGSRRIVQRATGIHSTIVAGRVVFQEGLHTGDLPGRLIRASSGG